MAFIPNIDVLDANGDSLIVTNADGTVPVVQLQLAAGLKGTFAKDGDVGTITIAPDPSVAQPTLTVGPYTIYSNGQVTTVGDQSTNLIASPIVIGNRQSVKLRITYRAAIFGQTTVAVYEQVAETTAARLTAGFVNTWGSNISDESNVAPPFTGAVPVQSLTVLGAVNDGTGKIKLSLASGGPFPPTVNMVAGQTIIEVANVNGVPNANGVWIADSFPTTSTVVLRGSTFAGTYISGGSALALGSVAIVESPNSLQLQAVGLKGPAWAQGEPVSQGDIRFPASGNLYLCTTGGTTLGSGAGPTGTGSNIDDNGVKWEAIAIGVNAATVIWQIATVETWTLQG